MRYLLLIFLLLSFGFIEAQSNNNGRRNGNFFQMGARAGIQNTETSISPKNTAFVRGGESQMGFHAGLYTRFNFRVFYIEPEAYFSQLRGEYEFMHQNNESTYRNFSLNRFDVPVNIGQKFGPLRIYGGINYSFNRAEGTTSTISAGVRDQSKAWRAGIGLDASNFSLDVRYESSWGNTIDGIVQNGETLDVGTRFSSIYLSLGYRLF